MIITEICLIYFNSRSVLSILTECFAVNFNFYRLVHKKLKPCSVLVKTFPRYQDRQWNL